MKTKWEITCEPAVETRLSLKLVDSWGAFEVLECRATWPHWNCELESIWHCTVTHLNVMVWESRHLVDGSCHSCFVTGRCCPRAHVQRPSSTYTGFISLNGKRSVIFDLNTKVMKRMTNLKNDVVIWVQAERGRGKGGDVARAQERNSIGLNTPNDGTLATAWCKATAAGRYGQRQYATLMPTCRLYCTWSESTIGKLPYLNDQLQHDVTNDITDFVQIYHLDSAVRTARKQHVWTCSTTPCQTRHQPCWININNGMKCLANIPSWTSILPRDVQITDIVADAESTFQRETTWSSLPVASIPLRENASAVTFPLVTWTVWLLKYSTGGGSWSSGAVFIEAFISGLHVRMVESLPLEISWKGIVVTQIIS